MKKVGFLYSDVFLKHIPPGFHPERPERLTAIIESLKSSNLWKELLHIEPKKAEIEDLALVHEKAYIDRILKATPGYLDPDTYFSEGTLEAALYASGAVITAIEACKEGRIERAFCAVRPPGHHAEPGYAMGFCIFNNIAVGARKAQRLGYERVFIVDFDVHHGNGTEHIFAEDDSVFYFSTHQYPHYPGTGRAEDRGRGKGEGFTLNIPMPSGAGDDEYRKAYEEKLKPEMQRFDPSIVLVSAGYDIHKDDPLSDIRLSTEGIRTIVRAVLEGANGVPVVFALEGGYNLKALGESVVATIDEMIKESQTPLSADLK